MSKPIGDIELQIMWNRLIAVVEEQAQTLLRTAFSSIVREAGDLSAGIFDRQGRMLAQAVTGTPGHVNSMAESVKHFLAHFRLDTMQPGDDYITNDPWMGTGHLNDFVVTTPCFHKGKLVGLFSCTSHLMDIGGIGFGPDGTDVFMEGLYIPFLKVLDAGKVNETLMAMIRANTRLPVDTVGDVYSLMACNDVGCQRLVEMMDEFDLDNLDELAEHICAKSRAAVLAEIAQLPKGSWSQRHDHRRLRRADHAARHHHHQRRRHRRRLHRHRPAGAARHQRAVRLHHGLHGVRARLHRGEPHPQQRRLAGSPHACRRPRAASSTPGSRLPCASAT